MADTPWIGSEADKLYLQSGQFTSTLKTSQAIGSIDTYPTGIEWDSADTPWSGRETPKLYLQSGQFSSTVKTSEAVDSIDTWLMGMSYDGTDTPWIGYEAGKLYLQSGQFTSTLKTSQAIISIDNSPSGISYDGVNTPWSGVEDATGKLYLQSGQFTSTLKTSQDIGSPGSPRGISWDGINTPWTGVKVGVGKLYLQSGQFSSTLKTSENINSVDVGPQDISTNSYAGRLGIAQEFFVNTSDAVTVNDTASFIAAYVVAASDTLSLNDEVIVYIPGTTATPWAGEQAHKLYLQSGQFTSTVKDSEDVSSLAPSLAIGICWDGNDTPWSSDYANKLYLQSGQFTSTLKTSQDISSIDTAIADISADQVNTPWVGGADDKLYLQSGRFTSTLKDSEPIGSIELQVHGISYDGTNTPWCGHFDNKLYLQSGQFTSTLKTSYDVTAVDADPTAISWDGINTPWAGAGDDKLYLQSGQFTSTLKTSQDVSTVDDVVVGISTNDYEGRIGGIFVSASDTVVVNDTAGFIAAYVIAASDTLSLSDKAITESVGIDALILIDEAIGRIAINLTYYGTLEEAGEYFETRLYEWAWSAASSKNKERALIEARCLIDGLRYKGHKHTVYEVMKQWEEGTEINDDKLAEIRAAERTQWNEFPRGVDVEIPEDILIAQYEIAHSLLDNKDPQLELELLAITSATYGGVKTMYQREQLPLEHLINLIPNVLAWQQLRPYLRDGDTIKLSRVS